jgi:hypothetical protein
MDCVAFCQFLCNKGGSLSIVEKLSRSHDGSFESGDFWVRSRCARIEMAVDIAVLIDMNCDPS